MSLPLLRGERLNKIYTCVSTTCEAYTVGGQPHSPSVYTLHRKIITLTQTQIWYTCTSQEATMFSKFRARSAKWGQKEGFGRFRRSRVFLFSIGQRRDHFVNFQTGHFSKFVHDEMCRRDFQYFWLGVICLQKPPN